ncbi:polysaccharide deacetylase family protein [Streptomyces sp. NPDC001922]|uniref:polysaccharide deacetylase family protein n=1 Tax=Streptomyces sp. NPDC001922 TaxID=3364624 RepID=UPI0036A7854F
MSFNGPVTPLDRRAALRAAAAGVLATGCTDSRPPRSAGNSPAPPGTAPTPSRAAAPRLPGQVEHGPRDRPRVALTFHGQGAPALADALLAEAERAGARLTVCAVGTWLDAYPELARRVLDGGHELGNHTQHHVDICSLPADAAQDEITACADRLRRLTGSVGAWFRPSRARLATPLVRRLARRAGYPHCLAYDLDSRDHTDPGSAAVVRTVLDGIRPGSVVSLHLGHAGTVAAMPALLDGLHHRGLHAVTATELMA